MDTKADDFTFVDDLRDLRRLEGAIGQLDTADAAARREDAHSVIARLARRPTMPGVSRGNSDCP